MGIAERREREKQQRRNLILDAAEKVFFSKDLNTATMDEIAETAELSKGTLYLYFKSKEDLFFGITQRALTLLKKMFEDAVKKENTGIKKVRAIGEAYYEYSKKYSSYFHTILHYEVTQINLPSDEGVVEMCHELGRQVLQILVGAIQAGIADGSIRNDIDPVQTAYLLEGQSSGIIQLVTREKEHIKKMERFEPEDLISNFFRFVLNALTPPKE